MFIMSSNDRKLLFTALANLVSAIRGNINEVSAMREDIKAVVAEVAAQKDLIQSATMAFQTLSQQIHDAADTEDMDAIRKLADDVHANSAALAAAIPQNTPAAQTVQPGDNTQPTQAASTDQGSADPATGA
jgi:hypothetical protein